jgi:hypothetical protein
VPTNARVDDGDDVDMEEDLHIIFDVSHKVENNLIQPCRTALKNVGNLGIGSGFRAVLRTANDNGGQYEDDSDKIESYLIGKIPEATTLLALAQNEDEAITKILQICVYHSKLLKQANLQFYSCIHQEKRSPVNVATRTVHH